MAGGEVAADPFEQKHNIASMACSPPRQNVESEGLGALGMPQDPADILIIGAGASGAAVAWRLSDAGLRIVCPAT